MICNRFLSNRFSCCASQSKYFIGISFVFIWVEIFFLILSNLSTCSANEICIYFLYTSLFLSNWLVTTKKIFTIYRKKNRKCYNKKLPIWNEFNEEKKIGQFFVVRKLESSSLFWEKQIKGEKKKCLNKLYVTQLKNIYLSKSKAMEFSTNLFQWFIISIFFFSKQNWCSDLYKIHDFFELALDASYKNEHWPEIPCFNT